jgi:hypothetical protein
MTITPMIPTPPFLLFISISCSAINSSALPTRGPEPGRLPAS